MKSLYLDGVKQVSLQERDVPSIGEADILVRLESRGICGTDLNSYRTGMPTGFGHEMAGTVVEAGKDAKVAVGTRVFISNLAPQNLIGYEPENPIAYFGGFAEYIGVRNAELGNGVYELPEGMSFSEGALVEPFCVAMSGVRKANITPESKVVIFGAGIIGMLAFEYLKSQGVKDVVIADIAEPRLAKAAEAGAIAFNSGKGDLRTFLMETFGAGFSPLGEVPNVNVWIDAAGVGALVSSAVDMAAYLSEVVVLAVHHKPAELNLLSVMYNNMAIHGSLMYAPEDTERAIKIISADHSIATTMISHEIPFEQAVDAFATADDASASLKVMMVR